MNSSSHSSSSFGIFDREGEEEEEHRSINDVEDVVFQLKYAKDADFQFALDALGTLITEKTVGKEWIIAEGIVQILFNRLGSSKHGNNRLSIILLLSSLASKNEEIKEAMADVCSLSTLVRSLARDVEERREAVALLLDISVIPAVRKRIGRIQGCIVMLVALLNGDDSLASHDAEILLGTLSNNTQDVLHMAEAGYFKPLVQHLKQGNPRVTSLSRSTCHFLILSHGTKLAPTTKVWFGFAKSQGCFGEEKK